MSKLIFGILALALIHSPGQADENNGGGSGTSGSGNQAPESAAKDLTPQARAVGNYEASNSSKGEADQKLGNNGPNLQEGQTMPRGTSTANTPDDPNNPANRI